MKAIRVHEPGPSCVLALENVPDPVPAEDEVLIEVRATGVNPVDTYIRSGKYAHLPPYPYIPGSDAAGVVAQAGSRVTNLSVGDRVYLMDNGLGSGAYAELVSRPARSVAPIPEQITFEQAAAINIPYATAHRALIFRGGLRGADTVLVHGGSGGVGIAAVQIAVATGARVYTTAGSTRGVALAKAQGVAHCFDHAQPDYISDIRRLVPDGFDLIVENLANTNLDLDLTMLAKFGRIVVVGSRGRVEIDPRAILQKDALVCGMALWNASEEDVVRIHATLFAGLSNGSLRPVVGRQFSLAEANVAHEAVMERGAYGKIVLLPQLN